MQNDFFYPKQDARPVYLVFFCLFCPFSLNERTLIHDNKSWKSICQMAKKARKICQLFYNGSHSKCQAWR